ncbi:MAG: hypothetical protein HYY64_15980 [Candidatus Rokubacteria bacterium]|nr:hypothetical protein [Candidatus Rokubacteria bacterium]
MFYSAKGYRIALPAAREWQVVADGRADLELRRPASRSGILVNATCEGRGPTRPLAVLARHLTFGVQGKEVREQSELTVAGHPAIKLLLTGRLDGVPVEVEAYVVKGERCVYDLVYVASPGEFAGGTAEFETFVSSFNGP